MDIINDKVKPLYFRYLAAASGSAMVSCIFGMVDAMMVGQYHGPDGNAALAVFNPIWTIIFCLSMIAGIGSSVLFSNDRGRGDEKNAQQYFTLAIIYGIILSAAAMLGIGFFNEELFILFGADEKLLVMAQSYLKPIFFAIPFCLFNNIFSSYLRNDGNPGLATKAVIIGGIFNVFADYLCVFVLDLGIFGAGIATAIGQSLTTAIMGIHFFQKKNTLRFVKPDHALQKIGKITTIGFSTGINDLAMGIIGICFNRQIMAHLGSDALAVYGVITQITVFAQCLSYGCGQAAQPIISQGYGAGRYNRITECLKYGLYTSFAFGIFFTAAMLLVPNLFVNFFMDATPSVLEIAPGILRAYGLSYVLLPFNIFATYYFQAIMKSKISVVFSLARGLFVSGALIIAMPYLIGPNSIWYAMLITEVVCAVFGIYYMIKDTKELKL